MSGSKKTFEVIVDRIEENIAVIILPGGSDRISCPANLLPESVKESDVVKITIEVDKERTEEVKADAQQILAELTHQSAKK